MKEKQVIGKCVPVFEGDHNLQARRVPKHWIANVRIIRFKAPKAADISLRRIAEIKTLTGRFCECKVLRVPKHRKNDSVQVGENYIFNVDNVDLERVAG